MKVLCPVDFSVASVDAVRYALRLLDERESMHLELMHCVYNGFRAEIFGDRVAYLEQHAKEDMAVLLEEVQQLAPEVFVSQVTRRGDPLQLVADHLGAQDFDYVVIGTKGLRAYRETPFGSLTEQLFEQSATPVLAVPQAYVMQSLDKVLLALDTGVISEAKVLDPLLRLVRRHESKLQLVHVRQPGDSQLEYDPGIDHLLKGIDYDYHSKYTKTSVHQALGEACVEADADLLCMIHRDRGWMLNLWHRSQVKQELLHISLPILVLHD